MDKPESKTSTSLPNVDYQTSELVFEGQENQFVSQSNFIEIDFPKARTIKYEAGLPSITFSVDYQKVEAQLKIYASNLGKSDEM